MNSFYHEKQVLMQCGISAVNNLLQSEVYTRKSFNEIANNLPKYGNSFFSDYSNILGNYSADVLIIALQQQNKIVECFDVRKIADLETQLKQQHIQGLLINKVSKGIFGKSYHWIAILRIDDNYWMNLDSKQNQMKLNFFQLIEFISNIINNQGSFFFVYRMIEQYQNIKQPQEQKQEQLNQ